MLKNNFHINNWESFLVFSLIILVIAIVIYFVFFKLLKRIALKEDKDLQREDYQKFKTPTLLLLLSIAIYIIASSADIREDFSKIINHSLNIILIFSITWLLIALVGMGKNLILRRYDMGEKDNLKARKVYTQFKIFERIIITILIIISLAVALMTFDKIRSIGVSLFASAGIAGIILGFAAQKLLSNVIAGFQIAIAQPIRLDDVVIVEGEWGWVEEITITYVVVRIWDKRRLIVPTTYFIEKPFQNWTRISADILGTVFIYTDYNVPFDKLREELTRILESDKNWDGKVNVLQVTNSTEKTVEIRALVSAADSPSAWDLRVNVREKLIEFIQKNYPESLPKSRLTLEKENWK